MKAQIVGFRPPRGLVPWVACLLIGACTVDPGDPPEFLIGEIRDDQISVPVGEASPVTPIVELTNVGSKPCSLLGLLTEIDPATFENAADGTVSMGELEIGSRTYFMGIEVDGLPVAGSGADVEPGAVARVRYGGDGVPETTWRVLLCNGPGDFAGGRYTTLP